jgi:hypothetical protein
VSIVTLLAFVALNIILFKTLRLAGWRQSIRKSVLGILLFTILFFILGISCTQLSTAPPPGLGLGYPVFEGFGWSKVGILFIGWNMLGVIFLLLSIILSSNLWDRRKERKVLAILFANILLYCIGLVPYVAKGALTHGWAGGHVKIACNARISSFAIALNKYAHENDNRYPMVNTFDELISILSPYIERTHFPFRSPVGICPIGSALEQTPRQYIWNAKLAGKKIDMDELSDPNLSPIVCPYHGASHWDLNPLMKIQKEQE